jgi:hypothetical protein
MSDLRVIDELFAAIDALISDTADGDRQKKVMLEEFFFRVLCIFDGVEMPNDEWKGISLVPRAELPHDVKEINDGFLHDEWSDRTL